MRHFLGPPLHQVALWVGILAIAAVASVSIWLMQRDGATQTNPAALGTSASPSSSVRELVSGGRL